jgi:hypothetical protein
LLVSFDRCQAMIRRSNASIWAFSASNWVPRAATHARAISGLREEELKRVTGGVEPIGTIKAEQVLGIKPR